MRPAETFERARDVGAHGMFVAGLIVAMVVADVSIV